MANTNFSLPTPNAPQQRPGSWQVQNAPQQGFKAWPTLNAPPQGSQAWPTLSAPQEYFSVAPTMVAPMAQSASNPKGRRIVAWSLWVFAGGLAAGPALADYADQGLDAAMGWLATSAPSFLQPYLPKPLQAPTPLERRSSVSGTVAAAPVPAERATTAEAAAQPRRTPELAVQQPAARAPVIVAIAKPAEPERTAPQTQPRPAHGTHHKVAATEPEAPTRVATAKSAGHKPGEPTTDPFDGEAHGAAEPVAREPVAKASAAPAPVKSNPEKSGDALDDLMAGGTSESAGKPKGRRNTSKEIDAMLADVQKSEPAPPPKRTESAPLQPLTAADIAKAMTGVKTDANACGKRFGQVGIADLKLTVGKDGRIADVALHGKLADLPIAECVIKAARGAAFPRNAGLKFDYRINIQ